MQTRNGLQTLTLISTVFILFCTRPVEAASAAHSPAKFFKASLRFEPNRGQAAPQFDFVSHGKGYTVQLSSTEALVVLGQEQITMQVVGANKNAQPAASDVITTTMNYYLGNEPSIWKLDILTYAKVSYVIVYPGIDINNYGIGEHLVYDMIVENGAVLQHLVIISL